MLEIFRELYIRGDAAQLAATIDGIEQSLPDGWLRHRWFEGRIRTIGPEAAPVYCFVCAGDDRHPSASLFLTEFEPGTLFVSNIAPNPLGQLAPREFNAILEEFCERIVRPCAERTGVSVELTADRADLGDWLSETAVRKFRAFTTHANKNTGSAYPPDQERWLDFLVTAHREESRLDADTLRRWLIEVESWAPEVADQLAGEYAFGGLVLSYSEGHRGVA